MLLFPGDELRVNLTGDLDEFEIIDFLDRLGTLSKLSENSRGLKIPLDFSEGSKINAHPDVIRHCLHSLENFSKENELRTDSNDFSFMELAGCPMRSYSYTTNIKDWMLFAYFKDQSALESHERDSQENDWCPPDNWANGTDDERQAYQDFMKNQKKIK